MKVFMLGWEFPPFISGGLGTACYGLTKAMSNLGAEIVFVLPTMLEGEFASHVELLSPAQASRMSADGFGLPGLKNVMFRTVSSPLQAYSSPETYHHRVEQSTKQKQAGSRRNIVELTAGPMYYAGDIFAEVYRYADEVARMATNECFEVIHAHDWMTFPAAIAVKQTSDKPLIVQIHSTEFDRSGEHVNQGIYDIEREGMHAADKVIAVSHLTKQIILSRYGVPAEKIDVVYNGVDQNGNGQLRSWETGISKDEKIVLFLGRVTMQKGPDYFLAAAKRVLEVIDNVKFVIAGTGDMVHRIIEMAAGLGIGHKVLFTGFLRGEDVEKVFRMADLYVMPSVSEPFGIAPLEALNHDVPVIISKQSGVAEVLKHVLKVDFWDVDEIANKIIAVLKYRPLHMTLREQGNFEVRKLRWEDAARRCVEIYNETLIPV